MVQEENDSNIRLFEETKQHNIIDSTGVDVVIIQPTNKKSLKKSRRKEKKLRKKIKKMSNETKLMKLKEIGIIKSENVPVDIINVIFDNMV